MPYFKLIGKRSQYDMVMVGHLMNQRIDKRYPASLSKHHINILKTKLNYNGLIITDDLNMGALSYISKDKSKITRHCRECWGITCCFMNT